MRFSLQADQTLIEWEPLRKSENLPINNYTLVLNLRAWFSLAKAKGANQDPYWSRLDRAGWVSAFLPGTSWFCSRGNSSVRNWFTEWEVSKVLCLCLACA